jgi:hypothetical protein
LQSAQQWGTLIRGVMPAKPKGGATALMPRYGRYMFPLRPATRNLFLLVFVCIAFNLCLAQARYVICEDGSGRFEATVSSGVSVTVGATMSGGLGKRSCSGALSWDGRVSSVVAEASQVDIDILNVDLGLGVPVVAFQVKKSSADDGMTYEIYTLKKPPRLLRTIVGGDFFSAADTNLNGRIEIWTGDAGAVRGFDDLGEFDFAPTMVLRFERGKLIDVSSEFQAYFDEQIAKLRTELSAQELSDFRNSDGKLTPASSLTVAEILQMHRLRTTKIKVLEIVWSYLYSGRDKEARSSLAEMWPPADFDRIRTAILNARSRGIRSQIDGVSTRGTERHFKKHAYVFDAITEDPKGAEEHYPFVDVGPQAILLKRPSPIDMQEPLTHSDQMVELVIDAAGKVWSTKPIGNVDKDVIDATKGWKFIPAFSGGHAVPSRMRINVAPDR